MTTKQFNDNSNRKITIKICQSQKMSIATKDTARDNNNKRDDNNKPRDDNKKPRGENKQPRGDNNKTRGDNKKTRDVFVHVHHRLGRSPNCLKDGNQG